MGSPELDFFHVLRAKTFLARPFGREYVIKCVPEKMFQKHFLLSMLTLPSAFASTFENMVSGLEEGIILAMRAMQMSGIRKATMQNCLGYVIF